MDSAFTVVIGVTLVRSLPLAYAAVPGIEGFRAAAATLGLRIEAPDLPWWKDNGVAINDTNAQNALLSHDIRRALLELLATKEHVHMTTDSLTVRTRTKVSPGTFAELLRPMSALEKTIERQLTSAP